MTVRTKYGNRKVSVDGYTFDSQAEAKRYKQLALAQLAGSIENLTLQPQFKLLASFVNSQGKRVRGITYIADFTYVENGISIVEDVKGKRTKDYIIKSKFFQHLYPEYKFIEVALSDI